MKTLKETSGWPVAWTTPNHAAFIDKKVGYFRESLKTLDVFDASAQPKS